MPEPHATTMTFLVVGLLVFLGVHSVRIVAVDNPKYRELNGRLVVARASDLPGPPDLAVICTPASTVAGLIEDLGRLGTKAVVVLTAGMSDKQKRPCWPRPSAMCCAFWGPIAQACWRHTGA